jgi:hypothetical protein
MWVSYELLHDDDRGPTRERPHTALMKTLVNCAWGVTDKTPATAMLPLGVMLPLGMLRRPRGPCSPARPCTPCPHGLQSNTP